MPARHHHYLSQCYLKGFTNGGGKKSKLIVFDHQEQTYFETIPRNVGGIRDFNRIDVNGVDQNILETSLSEFEGTAALALHKLREGAKFEGEVRITILNLIALLASRSPERREHLRKFQAQITERMMDVTLATKEHWEARIRKMKESGVEFDESITYEAVKNFHERKEYTIEVAREHLINMEFIAIDAVLSALDNREWLIVKTTKESGPLITTDHPVTLTWKEPAKIPSFYRNSPGYGMRDTQVYFPLSQDAALIGEFAGHEGAVDGTRELIAGLNSKMLMFAYKQIYAPKLSFYFWGKNEEILEGKHLLKHIIA
ncbi:MAG: DUF4238 domain-containing protein [Candidatus Binatia bacterium]